MRVHPKGNPLWKWWWPLGGVAVAAFIAIGVSVGWSAELWAAAAVVAAVYLGAPVLAATLPELTGRRERSATVTASGTDANSVQASANSPTGTPDARPSPEVTMAAGPPARGDVARQPNSAAANTSPGHAADAQLGPASPDPPSQDMLRRRIAAMSQPPSRPPEQPGSRPWRRVGSTQFADLVHALGAILPSVSEANATAARAGVTRHLIRGGQDNPLLRWQAVLEQAIDDGVDDTVCAEALKLTNSARLRAAVANWIGEFP